MTCSTKQQNQKKLFLFFLLTYLLTRLQSVYTLRTKLERGPGTEPVSESGNFYVFRVFGHKIAYLKGKGSLYSITERRVLLLIPVLGSQPAGDVNHKPEGRLSLLSARPAVTPATLMAATNFAAW